MKKHNIEYFEDKHQYLIDGIIVPCVSSLVSYATGNTYSSIPESILIKAREHGTNVHNAIEDYERNGTISEEYKKEIDSYIELKNKYMLNVASMEQIVNYETYYCGRYDILDDTGTLWDIKTTSKYREELLEWQLGLYYLAMGVEKEVGYCIYIPKRGKAKVKLVKPKSNKECVQLVEMFNEHPTTEE